MRSWADLGRILDEFVGSLGLRRILDVLGRILDGYWMNSWAPIGLGKDIGCILGRIMDELPGSNWFGK